MDDAQTALAGREPSSKAAKLRAALPEINAALIKGVSHLDILATLNQHGFDMSFTVYQTTLARIRKPPTKEKHDAAKASAPAKEIPERPEQKQISGKLPFKFENTAKNKWE